VTSFVSYFYKNKPEATEKVAAAAAREAIGRAQ
jgi:hypothetical protein